MAKSFTVQDFFKRFPDDDACLDHLMQTRFGTTLDCPKCRKRGRFVRLANLPAYSCPWCGHHIHPMVGTPFERSSTPLQKWFYAMYLFTTTRHGVPAKELQRQLGVTYKTAWRMGHKIRKYLTRIDGDPDLNGHVEIDETFVGGKKKGVGAGHPARYKTVVFGMLQRGGVVRTQTVPDANRKTLIPLIVAKVEPGSTISTDEASAYLTLSEGGRYAHVAVNHHQKEYVRGIHHVNGLEGFWAQLKRSIRGTHIQVSAKHMWKYLGEFEFRYNMRGQRAGLMFARLLASF